MAGNSKTVEQQLRELKERMDRDAALLQQLQALAQSQAQGAGTSASADTNASASARTAAPSSANLAPAASPAVASGEVQNLTQIIDERLDEAKNNADAQRAAAPRSAYAAGSGGKKPVKSVHFSAGASAAANAAATGAAAAPAPAAPRAASSASAHVNPKALTPVERKKAFDRLFKCAKDELLGSGRLGHETLAAQLKRLEPRFNDLRVLINAYLDNPKVYHRDSGLVSNALSFAIDYCKDEQTEFVRMAGPKSRKENFEYLHNEGSRRLAIIFSSAISIPGASAAWEESQNNTRSLAFTEVINAYLDEVHDGKPYQDEIGLRNKYMQLAQSLLIDVLKENSERFPLPQFLVQQQSKPAAKPSK